MAAYGYRVDHKGRSVVISGDTGYSENLIRHAMGADLLVHEIFMVTDRSQFDSGFLKQLEVSHTVPEAAGRVFTRAGPRLAVVTHIGRVTAPSEEIEVAIRKTYSGRLYVGEDLMTFDIGESVELVSRK